MIPPEVSSADWLGGRKRRKIRGRFGPLVFFEMPQAPTIDQLVAETVWMAEKSSAHPLEILLGVNEADYLTKFLNDHIVIDPPIITAFGTTFMGLVVSPRSAEGVAVRYSTDNR